ncbi:hypothetical protein ACIB24_20410 [Spongisporangium articulatum]|uniref:DUF3592 domain-containing protein n=1 Tax=Spongisporangium articulatum TaxID=3362603 RepID=A0ABW8ASV9_9ACTN
MTRVNGRSPLAVPKHTRNLGHGGIWSPRRWDRPSFWFVLALSLVALLVGGVAAAALFDSPVTGTVVRCDFRPSTGRYSMNHTVCRTRWSSGGRQHEDDVEVPHWIEPGGTVPLQVDGEYATERHESATMALLLIPGILGLLSLVLFGYPPRRRS